MTAQLNEEAIAKAQAGEEMFQRIVALQPLFSVLPEQGLQSE